MVDFSNIGIDDSCIQILADYLELNANLRSIKLDNNLFTDYGVQKITERLQFNTKLVHISLKGCENITD